MAINRRECEYALGLLEKYHGQLHAENDQKVKEELETVISIFKSNLFGALIDIHGYYENLLKEASQSPGVAKKKAPILKEKWNHDRERNENATKSRRPHDTSTKEITVHVSLPNSMALQTKGTTVPQQNGNNKNVASSDNNKNTCVRNDSQGDTHSETSFSHTKNEHTTTTRSRGFDSSSFSHSRDVDGGGGDNSGVGGHSCSEDN